MLLLPERLAASPAAKAHARAAEEPPRSFSAPFQPDAANMSLRQGRFATMRNSWPRRSRLKAGRTYSSSTRGSEAPRLLGMPGEQAIARDLAVLLERTGGRATEAVRPGTINRAPRRGKDAGVEYSTASVSWEFRQHPRTAARSADVTGPDVIDRSSHNKKTSAPLKQGRRQNQGSTVSFSRHSPRDFCQTKV